MHTARKNEQIKNGASGKPAAVAVGSKDVRTVSKAETAYSLRRGSLGDAGVADSDECSRHAEVKEHQTRLCIRHTRASC